MIIMKLGAFHGNLELWKQCSYIILELPQLFLMKRGGEEMYVGPLGRNSCHLIEYFEVSFTH